MKSLGLGSLGIAREFTSWTVDEHALLTGSALSGYGLGDITDPGEYK